MIGRDDDQSLVAACRAGDTQAFGVLVRRYQDRLFPTVLRLTGHEEDAYDLLQDAFLRAYQKLGHFQGHSSFYTWIYRIAVNLALSGRRKRRPVAERIEPADDPRHSDPSLPLERAERDARIQVALNALAADHRAVVVLKDLDGLRYEEIATILGIPVGTVRSRLHRARGELRDRLRGLVEEKPCSAADASNPWESHESRR
jgi:RNA polymerase sigma-70 factor (ECF subfamily)